MKHIIIAAFLLLLVTGCATPRSASYFDRLRDTTIPELELNNVSLQEALRALRIEWKKQTGTEMPVAEFSRDLEYEHDQPVTFRARYISFLEAVRIIANITGYEISFRDNELLVTEIRPWDLLSFQWELDSETKSGLGLGDKPKVDEIRAALEARGVDLSKPEMELHLLPGGTSLTVYGPWEDARHAEAVLFLLKKGYEVTKDRKSQPEH